MFVDESDVAFTKAASEAGVSAYVVAGLSARRIKPVLEALREAKGEGSAQLLNHLKKGEMATESEVLLNGSGWLPEVLRRADLASSDGEAIGEGQGEYAGQPESVDLLAFLTAGLPEGDASMMAAE